MWLGINVCRFPLPRELGMMNGFCSYLFLIRYKYIFFLSFNRSILKYTLLPWSTDIPFDATLCLLFKQRILKYWSFPLIYRRIVASSILIYFWRAFNCVHRGLNALNAIWFFLHGRTVTSILCTRFMLLDFRHTWDGNFLLFIAYACLCFQKLDSSLK